MVEESRRAGRRATSRELRAREMRQRNHWTVAPRPAIAGLLMCLGGYTSDTLLSAPKHAPLTLQLQASGRQLSLTKNPGESAEHLVLKALLWALLLPSHPEAKIEADLGLRYTPDVVALGDDSTPIWWGECGSVKSSKLSDLASAYPNARFSVAKWGRSDLRGYAATLSGELALPPGRTAPFELISFPADSVDRFVSDSGELSISWDQLEVISLGKDG